MKNIQIKNSIDILKESEIVKMPFLANIIIGTIKSVDKYIY